MLIKLRYIHMRVDISIYFCLIMFSFHSINLREFRDLRESQASKNKKTKKRISRFKICDQLFVNINYFLFNIYKTV